MPGGVNVAVMLEVAVSEKEQETPEQADAAPVPARAAVEPPVGVAVQLMPVPDVKLLVPTLQFVPEMEPEPPPAVETVRL